MTTTTLDLMTLNTLDATACGEAFTKCCGAHRWVGEMLSRRPFSTRDALLEAADTVWWNLEREDWLEAFTHHPKIGDIDSLKAKFANTKDWASGEQSGVNEASDDVIHALARGNTAYETRFGYIFIVCATGKSAAEMLALLEARLNNAPEDELKIAAEEQRKITRIRLEKLLS